jgi:hypothetical protein
VLAKLIKPRKLPSAWDFPRRFVAFDYWARKHSKGDAVLYEKLFIKACLHWFNDSPSCHLHCRSGCWFFRFYPDVMTAAVLEARRSEAGGGGAAGGAAASAVSDEGVGPAADDPEVPHAVRNAEADLTEFRVIREADFQQYIFIIIVLLVDRFEKAGGLASGQTNLVEAWHSKLSMPQWAPKRTYFSRYWQVCQLLLSP